MEKMLTNIDILHNFLQYFNLHEQLTLRKVCSQFRDVLDFIIKNKYKELEVINTSEEFIISNNIVQTQFNKLKNINGSKIMRFENSILLNGELTKDFLEINSNKAISLNTLYMDDDFSPKEFGLTFDNSSWSLTNLTVVVFKAINLKDLDLELLNVNCPNLEKLYLNDCYDVDGHFLVMGEGVNVATIKSMSMLKHFQLKKSHYLCSEMSVHKYLQVHDILVSLKNIKHLTIKVPMLDNDEIEFNDDDETYEKMQVDSQEDDLYQLEELNVGGFTCLRSFQTFVQTFLIHLKQLKKLSLIANGFITMNETFFHILIKTCKNLKYLKLKGFVIVSFIPLYTLDELVLKSCHNLKWNDLKQILCDMKLKSLTSCIGPGYSCTYFEFFNISNTLENLYIFDCSNNMVNLLKMNGQNFRKLLNFHWAFDNEKTGDIIKTILTNCPKLQALNVPFNDFLVTDLYRLKSLENLVVQIDDNFIALSQLLEIFKHSSLKLFSIAFRDSHVIYDKKLQDQPDLKTNLSFLYIHVYKYDVRFNKFVSALLWLINNNPKLTITLFYCEEEFEAIPLTLLIQYIIHSSQLPSRLKSIKISGFNVEIKDLQENFEAAMEKVKLYNVYSYNRGEQYVLLKLT